MTGSLPKKNTTSILNYIEQIIEKIQLVQLLNRPNNLRKIIKFETPPQSNQIL